MTCDSVRFLHITIFRVRNPCLTDLSFRINICDVRGKRSEARHKPACRRIFNPDPRSNMCKQPFFKEKRTNYRYFQDTILLKEGPYMYIFLQSILRMTAWPMTPPVPYSAFHILLTVFGAGFAVFFARLFGKKIRSMASPEPYFRHIFFSCGVLLALMELYKLSLIHI